MSAPHVAGVAALLMHQPSNLVANDDQVGANDIGLRRDRRERIRDRSSSSVREPDILDRTTRPILGSFITAGSTTGSRSYAARRRSGSGHMCCAREAGYSMDPSDMNVASIAIGDLAGVQTVTRKVTNVGTSAATYTPSTTASDRITCSVNPSFAVAHPGANGNLHRHVHSHDSTARCLRWRPTDMDWRAAQRPHPVGYSPRANCRAA